MTTENDNRKPGFAALFHWLNTDIMAALIASVVLAGSIMPRQQMATLSSFDDGIQHIAAYGALAFLVAWRRRTWAGVGAACLAVLLFGGIVEWVQPFFGRDGEWRDLLADGAGIFAGVGLAFLSKAVLMRNRL